MKGGEEDEHSIRGSKIHHGHPGQRGPQLGGVAVHGALGQARGPGGVHNEQEIVAVGRNFRLLPGLSPFKFPVVFSGFR